MKLYTMNKSLFTLSRICLVFFIWMAMLPCANSQQVQPPGKSPINVAKNINPSDLAEPLDHNVNTPFMELGPLPTKDGKRLYFSRQGYPENTGGTEDEDIWYSEFDEASQSWTKANNLGPPLNNSGPNFITGIGRKGDTLLLANEYRKNGKMRAGVSVSIRVGQLWSFPVPVNIAADYNFAGRTSYDLSHDRNALIIAQHKMDSHGSLDLYVSLRDPDNRHSYTGLESINLGSVINTFGDETSPWLSYDGKTLYFSSNGHNGYGNMDIFVSTRLDHTWTNWSEPENLGPGINSVFDDFSFNYNPLSRYAYFVRGLSSKNSDIFKVDMTHLFLEIDENPAEIGQTKIISSVFDDNQTEITPNATNDLESVLNYLKKNDNMLVVVTAHSNEHGQRTESFKLSNERAGKIVDYLVKNGVEKERLSYKGLGHDVVVTLKGQPNKKESDMKRMASTVEFTLINHED